MTAPREPAPSVVAQSVPILPGLEPLAAGYDGFILDLWGTIHDGYRPLPGAVDCLERLCRAGKRILILSNAPRRAHSVIERMDAIGVPRGLYHGVLSSGEAAHLALRDRADPWHGALGETCLLLGPPDDDSVLEGLGFRRANAPPAADFIVGVGTFQRSDTLAVYEDLLREGAGQGLPMVCCNPDLEVLRGDVRELCAGALASRYEALGGDVFWHGKPYAAIYAMSLDRLGLDDPGRILAVGDSLRTDIAGAAAAGIESVLVTSGIHAETLGVPPFEDPDPARLGALCAEGGQHPAAAMAAFRW